MNELKKGHDIIDILGIMPQFSKIRHVSISKIQVSGLNDEIYKQIDPDDPLSKTGCFHL